MAESTTAIGRSLREAVAQPDTGQGPAYRILGVAEESRDFSRLLTRLHLEGYEVARTPRSLAPALRALYSFSPDALLVDTSGDCDCREVFRMLQMASPAPAIVIGVDSEEQEVWYLDQGAAEYLVPPVTFPLMHAHLRAVLRWRGRRRAAAVIRVGDLEVDEADHSVRYRGKPVPVTPTEFRLLQAMAENKGHACSHKMLLERAWGRQFASCTNYLRLYIAYLRQKLEDDPSDPALILTEWGIGYRLVEPKRRPLSMRRQATTVA
jgi:two-component system KDP operon response regulator KdpE